MIAYKGFHPGLVCRGYQFRMGLNVTEKANCTHNGFHCAEDPLDCLTYYRDMDRSEYYLVSAGGDIDEDGDDTKISCTELTVLKELGREEFFLHALAYMADHPRRECNWHVQKESGTAQDGFTVVRGVAPMARGPLGSILAMAKEDPSTGEVTQVALARVEGVKIRPDTWYDIDFRMEEGRYS